MRKQYQIVISAAVVTAGMLVAGRALAGSLDPTNAPGPTMHTLDEIHQEQEVTTNILINVAEAVLANLAEIRNVQAYTTNMLEGLLSPQSLSATTTVVNAGYYAATNLTQVDADLAAGNIKKDTVIFGITGTHEGGGIVYTNTTAAVAKTGQTTSYRAGDDGYFTNGVAWPNPRFTVQANTNVVKDNLTGLMWARNANLPGGTRTWNDAIDYCANLTYGGYDDWRLPNMKELESLIVYVWTYPALCNTAGTGQWTENDPFTGVQSATYCSSTTLADEAGYAWSLGPDTGGVSAGDKAVARSVWPVRGGQ